MESVMRRQAFITLKWRKVKVSAEGIPAILALVAVALCCVIALQLTHSIGCDLLNLCMLTR